MTTTAYKYYSRKRNRGFRNVGANLFRTHKYDIPTETIPAGSFQGQLASAVVMSTKVKITNSVGNQQGMIFGFGDATNSMTVAWESASAGVLSVSSGTGGLARFNVSPGITLPVGLWIKNTGFVTNTAYNHSAIITGSADGWFETSIAFGSNETGTWAFNYIKFIVGVNEGFPQTNSSSLIFDSARFDNNDVIDLAWGVVPGANKARLWANGEIVARDDAGNYSTAVWSNDGAGSFADVPKITYNGVDPNARIAPSGFSVIKPLSIFTGQIPQHFF